MIHINQELDIDGLIEEIEERWCIGLPQGMNPEKAIPVEAVMQLLAKYFPQIKDYADEPITTNNT